MRFILFAISICLGGCLFSNDSVGNLRNQSYEWNGLWMTSDEKILVTLSNPTWEAKFQDGTTWSVVMGEIKKIRFDTSSRVAGVDTVVENNYTLEISVSKAEKRLSDGTSLPLDTATANRNYGLKDGATISVGYTHSKSTPEKIFSNLCLPRRCSFSKSK